MLARSALFDLYGDYLRPRGGRAPVAALVKLLAPVGVAAPAVRTAVSRMVRQGWLHPVRVGTGPGYLLTPRAARRLDDTSARLHRNGRTWDGHFDLILPRRPLSVREMRRMRLLGYGRLGDQAWVAARAPDEVEATLAEVGVRYDRFSAAHAAGSPGAADVVGRAWDLHAVGRAYEEFLIAQEPLVAEVQSDEQAYAVRFALTHAWRATLSRDPQLPSALLPSGWPGAAASSFFERNALRLRPAADRFVDRCLASMMRGGRVGFSLHD